MDGFRLNLVDLLKDNFLAVLDEVFTSTKVRILRSLLVQKYQYGLAVLGEVFGEATASQYLYFCSIKLQQVSICTFCSIKLQQVSICTVVPGLRGSYNVLLH